MPELPEVETTLQGIKGVLDGQRIQSLIVRDSRLRWPVPVDLATQVRGQRIRSLKRRAKYILIELDSGSMIWHLGMSGSMRIVDSNTQINKHDHIDLQVDTGAIIRYNDPRRFGCLLWTQQHVLTHPLLASLGPEPLTGNFNGKSLFKKSRGRKLAVKNFIMDQKIVVGVGNIYASEALFLAGISPVRLAGRVSGARYAKLADHIKGVLTRAIKQGGTSLKDFSNAEGQPGYFKQELLVYGRAGEPCSQCDAKIQNRVIGQRASYYCPECQR